MEKIRRHFGLSPYTKMNTPTNDDEVRRCYIFLKGNTREQVSKIELRIV